MLAYDKDIKMYPNVYAPECRGTVATTRFLLLESELKTMIVSS